MQTGLRKNLLQMQRFGSPVIWGWKWYATKAGMKEYDPRLSKLLKGEIFIMPEMVDKQTIASEHWSSLNKIDEIIVASTPATFFRTEPMGGFYASSIRRLPWIISNGPVEEFIIYVQ